MFSSNASQVSSDANYIESVFSTFLYTGNGSTQTITNGIDLAGEGGLVWIKNRTGGPYDHMLLDTARGTSKYLNSNTTAAESTNAFQLTSFNSNGFTLGDGNFTNNSAATYVSWTFREQPKFFDVVTYTGNGVAGRQISHSLGSVPGCIIVKRTNASQYWYVYHRSLGSSNVVYLNATDASAANSAWNYTDPTSTNFSVSDYLSVNGAGDTYVAYLFAHDAGGFGLAGTDNVISCGNYTGVAYPNSQEVSLGFEPQWVMIKNTTTASGWSMWDSMRGMAVVPAANVAQAQLLEPNTSAAEGIQPGIYPTATGFVVKNGLTAISGLGDNFIYIAIRRGPMKVPTDGTKVFSAVKQTGGGTVTTGFPVDLLISTTPGSAGSFRSVDDRLRGASTTRSVQLYTNTTDAEAVGSGYGFGFDNNTGFKDSNYSASFVDLYLNFKRAPGFFDEVCYTGTGSTQTQAHNLGAIPELMIFKQRTGTARSWGVYVAALGNANQLLLNSDSNVGAATTLLNSTSPTASIFTVGSSVLSNQNGSAIVAYLFATCAGVSKVGNYTGTGTTQAINCGFTAGARFVMVKATSTTGDWIVVDTARGLVSGNDPTLALNSTAAEVTTNDWFDPSSTGFELSSAGGNLANTNGVSYLFLAVA